jgi:hypothetical protein
MVGGTRVVRTMVLVPGWWAAKGFLKDNHSQPIVSWLLSIPVLRCLQRFRIVNGVLTAVVQAQNACMTSYQHPVVCQLTILKLDDHGALNYVKHSYFTVHMLRLDCHSVDGG